MKQLRIGRDFVITAAAIAAMGESSFGASAAWVAAPVDTNWVTDANWNPAAAPGATSGTTNTDTATFAAGASTLLNVDAGRNIQNITFGTSTATFTLQGSALQLTSGGTILSNGSAGDQRITAALAIQGDGGSYTIQTDTPGTNRELIISGGISGVATPGNTTTLTLRGSSPGSNAIGTVGISNGAGGGNLALVKNDAGLWILSTANTYSGGTTINGGTLRADSSGNTTGPLGAGTLTLNGGTLRLQSSGGATFTNAISAASTGTISFRGNSTFAPTGISGTGTVGLASDANVTVTSTNFQNFGGVIDTSVTFFRLGNGYVENSLQNARLNIGASSSVFKQYGTNSTLTADIGALSGSGVLGGSAAGTGTMNYRIGNRAEDTLFSGQINDGSTKTGLIKVGLNTLTLSGINNYSRDTTISGGTLAISGTGSIANTPAIDVQASATLDVSAVAGGFVLGALQTLKGNGTVVGGMTVNGTIAPGASIGVLSVGATTLAGNTNMEIARDASNVLDFDELNSVSTLALGGVLNVTYDATHVNALTAGDSFDLFDGSLSSAFATINLPSLDSGLAWNTAQLSDGGDGSISVVAVPEPTTLGLAAIVGLGALRRRRMA